MQVYLYGSGVPHVMFFAGRDIEAAEELTWDYSAGSYGQTAKTAAGDSGTRAADSPESGGKGGGGDGSGGGGGGGGGKDGGGDGGGSGSGGDTIEARVRRKRSRKRSRASELAGREDGAAEADAGGRKECRCGAARCGGWLPAT